MDIQPVFTGLSFFNFVERFAGLGNKEEQLQQLLLVLESLGLVPKRVASGCFTSEDCPKCKTSKMRGENNKNTILGWRYKCRSTACGYSLSSSANTLFEKVRISILQVLELTFCFVLNKEMIFANEHCAVSKKCAVKWYGFCREICQRAITNKTQTDGGPEHEVQAYRRGLKSQKFTYKSIYLREVLGKKKAGEKLKIFLSEIADQYRGPFSPPPLQIHEAEIITDESVCNVENVIDTNQGKVIII
ncbi:hypothetical protein CHUAL_006784 [Chamberlinius hualienensis]